MTSRVESDGGPLGRGVVDCLSARGVVSTAGLGAACEARESGKVNKAYGIKKIINNYVTPD